MFGVGALLFFDESGPPCLWGMLGPHPREPDAAPFHDTISWQSVIPRPASTTHKLAVSETPLFANRRAFLFLDEPIELALDALRIALSAAPVVELTVETSLDFLPFFL